MRAGVACKLRGCEGGSGAAEAGTSVLASGGGGWWLLRTHCGMVLTILSEYPCHSPANPSAATVLRTASMVELYSCCPVSNCSRARITSGSLLLAPAHTWGRTGSEIHTEGLAGRERPK
eukprot:scaffold5312_cov118-Isochrysis_galbana.AAC.3